MVKRSHSTFNLIQVRISLVVTLMTYRIFKCWSSSQFENCAIHNSYIMVLFLLDSTILFAANLNVNLGLGSCPFNDDPYTPAISSTSSPNSIITSDDDIKLNRTEKKALWAPLPKMAMMKRQPADGCPLPVAPSYGEVVRFGILFYSWIRRSFTKWLIYAISEFFTTYSSS